MTMSAAASVSVIRNSAPGGFYGKLPARADFVARRLAHDLVARWDAWLQQSLAASEAALGPDWRDCYFTAPVWRFALPAAACGRTALAGVMMPSVDAVGRSFPFMVGCELARDADPLAVAAATGGWFEEAEVLALETLSDGFEMASLERRLPPIDLSPFVRPRRAGNPIAGGTPIGVWHELPMLSAIGSAARELTVVWRSPCLWWTKGSTRIRPGLAVTPGLIPPGGFAALLDGHWVRHGWTVATSAERQPAPAEGDDEWDRDV
jgi:type VI secretion system protein ImpM